MAQQSTFGKLYHSSVPTGAAAATYTAPVSDTALITSILCHNSSGGALLVELWLVPTAGSTTSSNKIWAKSIPNGESAALQLPFGLNSQDSIYALSAGANVSILISGSVIVSV